MSACQFLHYMVPKLIHLCVDYDHVKTNEFLATMALNRVIGQCAA
jgi:hypothetical protein